MLESQCKVAHYSPVWLPLTEVWLYNQVASLPKNIENHIVCRSVRNQEQFGISNVHCLKRDSFSYYVFHKALALFGLIDLFPYFETVLTKISPDVIHSHFGNNGWAIRSLARNLGAKHIVSFYGQDVSRLPSKKPEWIERYRELFREPDTQFLCEGNAMARALIVCSFLCF